MKETIAPRELAIEKSKHAFYDELKLGKLLPELKGYEMAYIFVIAMSYGVYHDIRKPIKNQKRSISQNFVEKNFGWLVKSIAISTSNDNLNILPDQAQIYLIAEEYANGGITYIENELKKSKPGEFQLTMEKELNKIMKK